MQQILNDITALGENELEQVQTVIKKTLESIRSDANRKNLETAKNILRSEWFKNVREYVNPGDSVEDIFCEEYWNLPLSARWCECRVGVPDFDGFPPCDNEDCWWKRDTDKFGYDRKYFKLVINENVGFCTRCYKKNVYHDCLEESAEGAESDALDVKVDEWIAEFSRTN